MNYETARRRVGFWIEPRRLSANSVCEFLALFDHAFRCTNIHHAISPSLNDPSQITVRSCNQKQTPPRLRYAGPLILKHVWLSSRVVSPTSHRKFPIWIFRCPAPSPHLPVVQPPCRACSRFTSSAFPQRLSPSTVKPPSNPGCGNGEQLLRCVWAMICCGLLATTSGTTRIIRDTVTVTLSTVRPSQVSHGIESQKTSPIDASIYSFRSSPEPRGSPRY